MRVSTIGFHTRLSTSCDFSRTELRLIEIIKKESCGTRVVELGNALIDLGFTMKTQSVVRIKSKLFFEMEIVINIRTNYFAMRKGQIIFLILQILLPILKP